MKPEIVQRYGDRNLPRYTSYPTAPHFSGAVGEADYRAWLAGIDPDTALSLYLHVPFCRSMCWYCGCHTTVTAREAPVTRYLDALSREIALAAEALPDRMTVRHLHFGGGSPTQMQPNQFALTALLRRRFDIADDAEVAIEIDPRTLSGEMVAALAESGVNRASVGVQSFDPEVQQAINRVQSLETVAAAVAGLRRAGIVGINFDLIYGLPRQTLGSCLDTIEQALRLEPDRLAVFGYAHVPSFKLHQRRIDSTLLPGGAARWEQARIIGDALTRAGYIEIGLDHYARPSDPLACCAGAGALHRNFQGYTTDPCEALIGLGSSSIGRLPQGYVQNVVLISEYEKRVREGRLPVSRGYAVDADDRLRAAVIERLMCEQQVDLASVCAAFGTDPNALLDSAELQPLLDDALIERIGFTIRVRPEARPLMRAVAAAFDRHLQVGDGRHAKAV
ncbi:MAG: oxygen-independent coproporphyrinogen III oxidase [Sphingosinicella sp.]|uniref:oxygen-independent coproporphyrinogen III oxidase n=1 Tax=Sphingosinicella sp. TaxID=1917971 RepID=UPI0040383A0F